MTEVFGPGPFALSSGPDVPALGAGRRVDAFTPPAVYPFTSTALTHFSQQLAAFEYGRAQIGFGDEAVSFTVHWRWFGPTIFTVNETSWGQGPF